MLSCFVTPDNCIKTKYTNIEQNVVITWYISGSMKFIIILQKIHFYCVCSEWVNDITIFIYKFPKQFDPQWMRILLRKYVIFYRFNCQINGHLWQQIKNKRYFFFFAKKNDNENRPCQVLTPLILLYVYVFCVHY